MRRKAMPVALALAGLTALAAVGVSGAGKDKGKADDSRAGLGAAGGESGVAKADVVHISIQTVPPRKAQVKWGGKLIGIIPAPHPLVVERPRDSGPLDLVIRMTGYLPVHTRAYTFTDSRVSVKLTPPNEKSKLFGYREEAPPPNPDAGAPAEPATVVSPPP